MAITKIKGDALIQSVWDGAAYRPIACLTSNSLTRTRNIIESQTKCDPGVITKTAGSQSYEVPFEGEYIDTTSATGETTLASHDFIMTLFDTGNLYSWRLATGLADTPYYYGEGVFSDLEMTGPAGDELATFSGTLSGSGLITTIDPEA